MRNSYNNIMGHKEDFGSVALQLSSSIMGQSFQIIKFRHFLIIQRADLIMKAPFNILKVIFKWQNENQLDYIPW